MKEINKNISLNIRQYMDTIGITQIELAKLLNCANTTVSTWVNGDATPRMDKIDRMCEIFGCARQDLISDTVKEPEQIQRDRLIATFTKNFMDLTAEQQLRVIAYMNQIKNWEDKT